jgi:predicted secreted protein
MAKHHGKNGVVKTSTYAIAHVTKFDINQSAETADASAMGSSWKEHIVGLKSWSGSLEGHFDPADTNGQASIDVGETITLGLYSDGADTGKKYLTGSAIVTAKNQSVSLSDLAKFSINFEGSGALSEATAT